MELGTTDVVQKHLPRTVVPPKRISQRRLDFEHARPRWLRECIAEAMGVFMYVLPGMGSIASFTLNLESPLGVTPYGSFLSIGFAFALGIAFAIITCAPTSGGHFSPAVTIALCVWQGFPLKKVPYYIFSQLLGGFIAALVIMGIYHQQIDAYKEALLAAGKPLVFNGGPASILVTLPNAGQSMGYVFLTEFFCSFFVGFVIWACIDPANPFISPSLAPLVIGLAYAAIIWAFADATITLNTARDFGPRIVAAIWYGREAFSYMTYSPIAILVSIPATLASSAFYEFVFRDSLQVIESGHAVHADGEEALVRHITRTTTVDGLEASSGEFKS